ncbi:endoplasmic reticulum junction formation protein lunapark-B-like isoform X2 [Lineus longissimus]|uniref:endoplasmic reticulum junction formation protein lunapark-B-like isoform X2 n=1 Tax=Lineus longissimus TaxID=88925 RepID=UPI00315D2CD2
MGAIISRWRKKPTTIEKLEEIDKEMESLHKLRRQNLQSQKRVIGQLILWSIVIYVAIALLFYFCYFPKNWKERLIHTTPLLFFPLLIWLAKRVLHWYFVKRIAKNESLLQELRDKKKEILEDVKENETYKKAKEILEKFDPESFKKLEPLTPPGTVPQKTPGTGLRQRSPQSVQGTANRPGPIGPTPRGPRPMGPGPITNQQSAMMAQSMQRNGPGQGPRPVSSVYPSGPPPQLPRPILPRERGAVDKLVEYLVGDGPQNRYALICRYCSSHNGMALKEEFEYMSFKCCYCFMLNPAKKQRLSAPRLPEYTPLLAPVQPKQLFMKKKEGSEDGSVESGATDSEREETSSPDLEAPETSRGSTPEHQRSSRGGTPDAEVQVGTNGHIAAADPDLGAPGDTPVQVSRETPEDLIDEGFTVLEPESNSGQEISADDTENIPENQESDNLKSEEDKKTD